MFSAASAGNSSIKSAMSNNPFAVRKIEPPPKPTVSSSAPLKSAPSVSASANSSSKSTFSFESFDNSQFSQPSGDKKMPAPQSSSKLECLVCYSSPPKTPCVSPCGHVCCLFCWKTWILQSSTSIKSNASNIVTSKIGSCPACKKEISIDKLKKVEVK